jgi:hypothetical protein
MRSDMAKVIVERPRHGSRQKARKGYRKQWQRFAPEDFPKREGVFAHKGRTKWFSERLGPLRKYLQKQVGRPWNMVFSEICEHLRCDSVIQSHVRDHLLDFIIVNVIEIDGTPCYGDGRRYAKPLQFGYWTFLYVCPRTGLVRRIKPAKQRSPANRICVSDALQYHRRDGRWLEVKLRRAPEDADGCWDALANQYVDERNRKSLAACYGFEAYAISVRPVSSEQQRELNKRSREPRR